MEKQYYKEYYHLERTHWWFKARLEILDSLISKQLKKGANGSSCSILNAGVATGATSTMLSKHGRVESLEYDKECCDFLRTVVKMEVINGSLTELPFPDNSFDLVCAFDVIEHIEDDLLAMKEVHRVLKPNGFCVITVPAFQFLWSEHDEINHHFRRYTRKQLVHVLTQASLTPSFHSYFNTVLFFPIAAIRILFSLLPPRFSFTKRKKSGSNFDLIRTHSLLEKLFYHLFKLELSFLKRSIKFPVGVSLISIAHPNK